MCIVTKSPREINLRELSEIERETWSEAEGWDASWIDQHLAAGGPAVGLQIRYTLKE